MAEIFSTAVREYPPAEDAFSSLSVPDLQDWVKDHASAARNYDPDAEVDEIQEFVDPLYKLAETSVLILLVLSALSGAGLWVTRSQGLLAALGALSQPLLTLVLLGPPILIVIAACILIYFRLLAFNSFFIKTLNPELVIVKEASTRDEDKLIGYGLWNASLNGGAGIKLLAIFSVLWVLSALIPRKDPYGFIKRLVRENIDIFAEADGVYHAWKLVIRRMRSDDAEGPEDEHGTSPVSEEMAIGDESN